jgi:hypothetical protein
MLKKLIFLLLLQTAGAEAQDISFAKNSTPFFQDKVKDALALLPSTFMVGVKGHIIFEEVKFSGDKFFTYNLCELDERITLGTTKRGIGKHRIAISSRLIELSQIVRERKDCSHGTFEKTLKATIIHELVHVKDSFAKISLEPDFQRIVGVKKVQKSSKKEVLNQNSMASPDAYELKNLEEALAVNFEYLIFDEEFECRKPATAKFLSQRFNIPLAGTCEKNYQVINQSAYLEDNYQTTTSLNPSRIYQIHYLFAGKGKGLMSRWGHSMFRLVVCAPHRKVVGPDCLRDVSHHLALSYRAFMNGPNISYLKGMFGKYPSQLFVLKFHEVQQEYTKFELRDLYSIPIRINEEQKQAFIDLTLERIWTYQGKYFFFNNNCGTETQKHLAVALSDEEADLVGSLTPLNIYQDILSSKNNLTDEGLDELDREQLIAQGYLLPRLYDELEEYYLHLYGEGIFQEKKFDKFLKKTSAKTRAEVYQKFFNNIASITPEKKMTVLKLVYLERYLFNRFTLAMPKKVMELMNKNAALKKEVQKMGQSLADLSLHPWQIVKGVYGVPLSREFETQYGSFKESRKLLLNESAEMQIQNLEKILGQDIFSQELEEIEYFKQIKQLTNKFILMMI